MNIKTNPKLYVPWTLNRKYTSPRKYTQEKKSS